jgi:hypothetical protein
MAVVIEPERGAADPRCIWKYAVDLGSVQFAGGRLVLHVFDLQG